MNKIIKGIKDPLRAIEIINRKYFQIGLTSKEPEVAFMKSWVYGKLKREKIQEIFPGIEKQSYEIINGFNRTDNMSMTLQEVNVVAAIVKFFKIINILEIGTFDGGTTITMAANMPDNGLVYTVDLPEDFKNFELNISSVSDNKSDAKNVGSQFKNTEFEKQIVQIFQDSAKIDFESINAPFDFIFIDGCHDYEYVKIDSINALKNIKKGGIIVWHDYGMIKDVSLYIDEIAEKNNIRAISGTRLAVCRIN